MHGAGARRFQAGEQAQSGRLAASRSAYQGDDLAGAEGKIEGSQSRKTGAVVDLDRRQGGDLPVDGGRRSQASLRRG